MARLLLALGCLLTACLAQSSSPAPGTIYEPGVVGSLCPITASSPSPQVDMLVWTQSPTDDDGNQQITSEIQQYFNNSGPALDLKNYTSEATGLRFWYITMTDADACGIGNIGGVEYVEVDGTDPNDEDDSPIPPGTPVELEKRQSVQPTATVLEVPVATQTSPVTELRIASQPEANRDLSQFSNYVFNENPGQGITIYIIDSGVNPTPFGDRYDPDTTIYAPGAPPGPQDDSVSVGHSTCNADKAAGSTYGIAKSATLIMAKKTGRISDTAVIYDMVRQDIVNRGLQGKAVVSLSSGTIPPGNGVIPPQWVSAGNDIKAIMNDLNVPFVTSAGNDAVSRNAPNIDKYPKIFQADDFPIINVGATNFDGTRASFSQAGPLLTVSAPGVGITCTNPTGSGTRTTQGTSYAAPQVAGLLAYFLAMDPVPFDTSDGELAAAAQVFLMNTASWIRGSPDNGDPLVAWNLITEDQNPPST